LRESCRLKISEAEETFQYVQIYLPNTLKDTKERIAQAREDWKNEDFAVCLNRASLAKAEANVILNVIGLDSAGYEEQVNKKSPLVEHLIARQIEKGNFPIVGYSYLQYANSLKSFDPSAAGLYLEYALELSNLDIYLKPKETFKGFDIDKELLGIFIMGVGVGIVAMKINSYRSPKKRKTQRRTRKPAAGKKR